MAPRRKALDTMRPEDVERAFHEQGVNTFLVHKWIPTIAEGVRRLIRAGHRDSLVLVSEATFPFAGSVRRALEAQIRAMGTDRLDVWLIGWLRKRWYARDAVWSEMVRLREAGRTRAIGFSCHDRPLAAALARALPADVIMIRYNAAHRGAEGDIFDALSDLGERRPGIISYTATRWGGLLKPIPERGFPEPIHAGECYRFVLDHPMVDVAWCAARNPAELREDVDAAVGPPLTPERRAEICRFGDAVHAVARGGERVMFQ
jgi:aryl-alcohol dehydrogenase-like predicted oxidoreductase